MEDSVPPEVKRERLHKLIEMQNEISYKVNQRRVGTVVEIMVEGVSEKNPNRLMGLSRENKVVLFPAKRRIESGNWRSGKLPARGDIVKIKVAEARAWTLYGDIAS